MNNLALIRHRGIRRGLCPCVVLLLGLLVPHLGAYGQADWTPHTPARSVTALSASDVALWVATTGGVFSYTPATGEVSRFTTTNGLSGIDAGAIAYDGVRDCVWIGYTDGTIDQLKVETGAVETFLDIERANQFPGRAIHNLSVLGDTLYVATAFGLVLFDPVQQEVRDAFSNLGTLNPATPARDVLVAPLPDGAPGLWVATDNGVARAPLSSVNLREPAAWTVEAGIPTPQARSLLWYNETLHVGTNTDVFALQADGTWAGLGLSSTGMSALLSTGNRLVGLAPFALNVLEANGTPRRIDVFFDDGTLSVEYNAPAALVQGPDGQIWLGDAVEGLIALPGIPEAGGEIRSAQAVVPAGPFLGLFTDLTFDAEGNLWAAGRRGAGSGFYRYDGQAWTTYAGRFVPALEGRDGFESIHIDAQGNVWAGSLGEGLARVSPDGAVDVFDPSNSSLQPSSAGGSFVVVRGVGSEADGQLWVSNEFSPQPLSVRLADGTWQALSNLRGDGIPASLDRYDRIHVDANNQKWILPVREAGQGLIVWDTNGTPTNRTDDRLKYLRGRGSGGRGLPDERITAWIQDRQGWVWIGSERGIAYYFFPQFVISDNPNEFEAQWPIGGEGANRSFLLRDLYVNDLAVDAADRKWIASRTGAWLINAEGTEVLEHFTSQNSPLFSDNVLAIAVDDRTGQIYFATDKGMLSFQGDAIAPAAEAQDLFVYPNPVTAQAGGTLPPVFIEGLVAQTRIRIVAPDGSLVRRITARGGRARWDGRDESGRLVPAGVYLVLAVGENDAGTARGKVAVVR